MPNAAGLSADALRGPLNVPLYLTVGAPLAIRAIREQLRPLRFPPPVRAWFNAFDTRDVVALYPLDRGNFPVTPAVENYAGVKNHTSNRRGIVGYLDDRGGPNSRRARRLGVAEPADSDDVGRAFRLMSATCSDRRRPAVPIDVGRGGGAPAGWM